MQNKADFETVLECYRRHNVDSFTDLPGNYFWEEFLLAYPKAKVKNGTRLYSIIQYC